MTTLIDSLMVEVGLDPSKFIKGSQDVDERVQKTSHTVEKSGKDIEDGARKTTQSLEKLQGQVLLLFSAFTAGKGIKDFITSIVQTDANLGRMAYTLDTTVQKLGTWANAGAMVGASAQEIIGSFQSLTADLEEFTLTGQSRVVPYLRALGINALDSTGHVRDLGDVFDELHQKMIAMGDPARAAQIMRDMGLSQGMINLELLPDAQYQQAKADGKKYAPTQADVQAALALQVAWNRLGMASSAMGRSFLTDLAPALVFVTKALTALANWFSAHPVAMTAVLSGLTVLVVALGAAVAIAAISFLGITAPVWAAIGAFVALGAAIGAISKDWDPISKKMEAFAKNGAVRDFVQDAKDQLNLLKAIFTGSGEDIRRAWAKVMGESNVETSAALKGIGRAAVIAIANIGHMIEDALTGAAASTLNWAQGRINAFANVVTGHDAFKATHYEGTHHAMITPKSAAAPGPVADLLSRGEGNYDSVNLGKRGGYKASTRKLENMTVSQVMQAQNNGEFNAAGRYQIIKGTLAEAANALHLSGDEKFDAALQDRILKDFILAVKRKPIGDYISGKSNDLNAALKAASKEWASVADPDTGKSYYDGVGNNKASIPVGDMANALRSARSNQTGIGIAPGQPGSTVPDTSPVPKVFGAPEAAVASNVNNSKSSTSTSSSETNINTLNVVTQAKDADGIASGIKGAIDRNNFAQQGNFGAT